MRTLTDYPMKKATLIKSKAATYSFVRDRLLTYLSESFEYPLRGAGLSTECVPTLLDGGPIDLMTIPKMALLADANSNGAFSLGTRSQTSL
jgi:hypothetical protein